jgi:preprotein translocase subunit YajC
MMNLTSSSAILALAPPASGQSTAPPWMNLVPLVLLVVVFYVALIRPQQKKAKEHANLLKTLRPGDKILTNGGIVGTVVTVKEKTVTLRSADAKLEIAKSAVGEIMERTGGEATPS